MSAGTYSSISTIHSYYLVAFYTIYLGDIFFVRRTAKQLWPCIDHRKEWFIARRNALLMLQFLHNSLFNCHNRSCICIFFHPATVCTLHVPINSAKLNFSSGSLRYKKGMMSAAAHLQACSLCEQMTLLSEKGKSHTEEFKFKVWCQHNENSHNRAPSTLPTKLYPVLNFLWT